MLSQCSLLLGVEFYPRQSEQHSTLCMQCSDLRSQLCVWQITLLAWNREATQGSVSQLHSCQNRSARLVNALRIKQLHVLIHLRCQATKFVHARACLPPTRFRLPAHSNRVATFANTLSMRGAGSA